MRNREQLLSRVEKLASEVGSLTEELAEARGSLSVVADLDRARQELEQLRAEQAVIEEKHARERREIEHKVGLHEQRAKQEKDLAEREAIVKVREENLSIDRARFDEQVEFVKSETEHVRKLSEQILARIPNVETLVRIGNGESVKDD